MIQLFIDYATNKIIGYNTIIPENTADIILVNDEEAKKLKNLDKNLYYENGEIIEKEEPDTLYSEIFATDKALITARNNVKNEYQIFMDNIISGMDMAEALQISKKHRAELENHEAQKNALTARHKSYTQKAVNRIFEKEEENILHKYFLSMLAIVRDENDYIEEWIRYHIEKLGFDHFYIYDNESAVPVKDYLTNKNFAYLDKLTIIDWKTSNWSQQDAYNDFYKNYRNETKWVFAADPDEYIFIKDNSKPLKEFLTENSDSAAIKCLWKHFNANGHEKKSNAPVMERFTQDTIWEDYKHGGKKFVQTNRIQGFASYVPQVRLDAQTLDYTDEIATNYFQLNHYYTKSYEEWVEKIHRGSSNPHFRRKYAEFFELNPDMAYLNTGENYAQPYGSANTNTESEDLRA